MKHLVLLGDSILDNGAYTNGGPDVAAQLRQKAPHDEITLLATDGDVTADIARQLANLPTSATHLVLSVGGNDALGQAEFLTRSANSVAEVLLQLHAIGEEFRAAHKNALELLAKTGIPFAVCTIYDANFAEAQTATLVKTALAVFNDAIIRNAMEFGAPILDLRAIFTEKSDYANEIEPSSQGAAKIADAVLRLVEEHTFEAKRTAIYV